MQTVSTHGLLFLATTFEVLPRIHFHVSAPVRCEGSAERSPTKQHGRPPTSVEGRPPPALSTPTAPLLALSTESRASSPCSRYSTPHRTGSTCAPQSAPPRPPSRRTTRTSPASRSPSATGPQTAHRQTRTHAPTH